MLEFQGDLAAYRAIGDGCLYAVMPRRLGKAGGALRTFCNGIGQG